MKLSLLKRLLKQNGAKFYCHGGSDDRRGCCGRGGAVSVHRQVLQEPLHR